MDELARVLFFSRQIVTWIVVWGFYELRGLRERVGLRGSLIVMVGFFGCGWIGTSVGFEVMRLLEGMRIARSERRVGFLFVRELFEQCLNSIKCLIGYLYR